MDPTQEFNLSGACNPDISGLIGQTENVFAGIMFYLF
jgi:hypothetical protein